MTSERKQTEKEIADWLDTKAANFETHFKGYFPPVILATMAEMHKTIADTVREGQYRG
jgi:hypothetical protein